MTSVANALRRCGRVAPCLLGVALVGCAVPREPPPAVAPLPRPMAEVPQPPAPPASAPAVAVPTSPEQAARDWLAWQQQLRPLAPEAVVQEVARMGDTPVSTAPGAAMRLALALSLTRNPADTLRALALLEQVQRSAAPDAAAWQPWARVQALALVEQRRMEEQADRQNQQQRDNQRRMDQLNEKLEALRAIERSLSRPPGAPAAGPAAPPPASAPAPAK